MLSVAEALAAVLQNCAPLPAVSYSLVDSPIGLFLAESIAADIDSPPYTKSMMDGYAVRSEDVRAAPVVLEVIEEIAAGANPVREVVRGSCARIMTGAPIPGGADAVVMLERTEAVGNAVRVAAPVNPGANILLRGTEMKVGDVVLRAGAELMPQDCGLLATLGRSAVQVHRRPAAAILTTGDEIVEPPERPGPGQIRNSNGPMLLAQAIRAGAVARYLGVARDDAAALRQLIGRAMHDSDLLILSGGVSAGKFDLVPGILLELGIVPHFHKVLLKPGKPLFFGTLGDKLVFGLPGNPVSSFVCFEVFIRTALRKLLGDPAPRSRSARLPLAVGFRAENDRPTYWPGRMDEVDGEMKVRPLPWKGAADLRGLHTANALIVLAPGPVELPPGQTVELLIL